VFCNRDSVDPEPRRDTLAVVVAQPEPDATNTGVWARGTRCDRSAGDRGDNVVLAAGQALDVAVEYKLRDRVVLLRRVCRRFCEKRREARDNSHVS